jgi:hypothetical protein
MASYYYYYYYYYCYYRQSLQSTTTIALAGFFPELRASVAWSRSDDRWTKKRGSIAPNKGVSKPKRE